MSQNMMETLAQRIPLRFVTILALVLPAVFAVLWISSATIDGLWAFGVDSLSRMGISEDRVAAALFNGGCIVCGAMGTIIGLGTAAHRERAGTLAGILYAAGMVFLLLVGVFPMDQPDIHYVVATLFFTLVLFSVIITAVDSRRLGRHFELDVLPFVLSILFMSTMVFPLWEALIVIIFMVWTILQGIRMARYDAVFSE